MVDFYYQPGAVCLVIGRVVHLHLAERMLIGEHMINLVAGKPVGYPSGNDYCQVTDIYEMTRPPLKSPKPSVMTVAVARLKLAKLAY